MQEQHPYKITPEQGWSAMLPALEKAMPVERNSRRFVLFWWTAAAVSVAALIMILLWVNVQPSIQENSISSNTSSQSKLETKHENSDNQNSSVIGSEKAEPASASAIDSDVSENKNQISNPSIKHNKYTNSRSNQKLTPLAENLQNGNEIPTGIFSSDVVYTDVVGSLDKSNVVAETGQLSASSYSVVLASIPNLDIKSLNIDEMDALDLTGFQATRVAQPKRNLIVPTLSAGALVGFEKGAGINAMAGVDVNLVPKLSLNVGVGYSSYQPDASLFNCCSDQEFGSPLLRSDLTYQGIGNYLPAESLFLAAGSDLNSFIETIRQWNLQAGLAYDVSRRIQLEGGVSLGFGTKTRSSYPIVSFDNSTPVSGDPFVVSYDLEDYNVIRSGSLGFYAGISYALTKRFDLYLRVLHSFDPYLATDQYSLTGGPGRSDYIRGINVGMRYNLQGP